MGGKAGRQIATGDTFKQTKVGPGWQDKRFYG